MKFFISAMDDDRAGLIAREIEAVDFDDAGDVLERLMVQTFGIGRGRKTSITEVPELGFEFPMAFMATGVVQAKLFNRECGK